MKAFEQSRQVAMHELRQVGTLFVSLPWLGDDLMRAEAVMGQDYWRYGVGANRLELESMVRWARADGLVSREMAVEEMFAASALDPARI
jgi:4,5-dihydroxyphthalate decarboxylase